MLTVVTDKVVDIIVCVDPTGEQPETPGTQVRKVIDSRRTLELRATFLADPLKQKLNGQYLNFVPRSHS